MSPSMMIDDPTSSRQLARMSPRWGGLLALGVVLVLVGIAALGATVSATLATVWFLGAVLLVGGVVEVVSAFSARGWHGFGLPLASGLLMAILGVMLMVRPDVGAGVLTLLLALVLVAAGAARLLFAISERFPGWGWYVASGVAGIALGAIVFAQFPVSALWLLGTVVAIELLFRGMTWIALAFLARRVGKAFERRPEMPATPAAPAPIA